eukprot:TRINITY_DN26021_c0_g1_i1.p1 TRINITY_DN26021_c0_g1~~TRINITY_DN26021_c0_g1_i1.p1  ORF type:complete len:672 (-),score=96.05 TRINITY_DN26021_c0_g1_i1:111-2126(-)
MGDYMEAPSSSTTPGLSVRPESATDLRPLVEIRENGVLARTKYSMIAPLTLRKEVVLDTALKRLGYHFVHILIRVLPFLVIYGGTLALAVCVAMQYRWGVLLSMMLYCSFMALSSLEMAFAGAYGMFLIYINARSDWFGMWQKEFFGDDRSPKSRRNGSDSPFNKESGGDSTTIAPDSNMPPTSFEFAECGPRDLQWNDVFHVVIMPTYKTPLEVLVSSITACSHFSLSRTNLGLCFAFEEREDGAREKVQQIKEQFSEDFALLTATYHPPNLPGHVPGKSSNECWAFQELQKELQHKYGIEPDDPRVLITVIDDDSELHENYFEGLNYHFLQSSLSERYLTIWQPPIVHFKNYLTQHSMIRNASTIASMHELACLANPLDCHVPFSSYSLPLILASAVGGWDPDMISEDWHMCAKCTLMTEGRAQVKPLFLPLINYAPEEETAWKSIKSRWTQATRHALGISEIVFIVQSTYVGMIECGSLWRAIVFLYRMLPLMAKFIVVHFSVATLAFWPLLAHILIYTYMYHSWCYVDELEAECQSCCVPMASSKIGVGEERIVLNSWTVYFQERANVSIAAALVTAGSWGAFYFHLIRDRVTGDWQADSVVSNPFLLWGRTVCELIGFGWFSTVFFGSIPEWMAAARIMVTLQFNHVVAGMVGRDDGQAAKRDGDL